MQLGVVLSFSEYLVGLVEQLREYLCPTQASLSGYFKKQEAMGFDHRILGLRLGKLRSNVLKAEKVCCELQL